MTTVSEKTWSDLVSSVVKPSEILNIGLCRGFLAVKRFGRFNNLAANLYEPMRTKGKTGER